MQQPEISIHPLIGRLQSNWALVRNQLDMDEKIQERIRKYENGGF